MLGLSKELRLEINDPKPFYTNGDRIEGRLIFKSSKARSLRSIKIKLKCQERSQIVNHVSYAGPGVNAAYSDDYKKTLIKVERELFPTGALKSSNSKSRGYTLQSGEHNFPFAVEIPDYVENFPQTYEFDKINGIRWWIDGIVYKASGLDKKKKATTPIHVQASRICDHIEFFPKKAASVEKELVAYLPGYSSLSKMKRLLPNNEFSRKVTAVLTVKYPKNGIFQGFQHVGLEIDLDVSTDPNLLVIRDFNLSLIERSIIQTEDARNETMVVPELLSLPDLNCELGDGIAKINDELSRTRIVHLLPPTKKDGVIQTAYHVLASMIIGSKENRHAKDRILLRAPLKLQCVLVENAGANEGLPSYHDINDLSVDKKLSNKKPAITDPASKNKAEYVVANRS